LYLFIAVYVVTIAIKKIINLKDVGRLSLFDAVSFNLKAIMTEARVRKIIL
jgi:hypothetical protein